MTEELPPAFHLLPFKDLVLTALGIGVTLSAGAAAVYASGYALSQPITPVHIVPLGVIVATVVTVPLLWFELDGLRRSRVTPAALVGGAAIVAGILLLVLGPTPGLSTPVGAALPWFVVSLVGALLGAVSLLLVQVIRRRRGLGGQPWEPVGALRAVLAIALTIGLIIGLGIGAHRLSAAYLDGVNEYRSAPVTAAEPPVRSALTGGVRWQVKTGERPWVASVTTPYGIVVRDARAITEVDAATGQVRWRYERSDVAPRDEPEVWAIENGQDLAVRWEKSGFFVLDARTGARVAHWPSTYAGDLVDGADATLLQDRQYRKRTTVTAVDVHGQRQWKYSAPDCQFAASAVRSPTIALVEVTSDCGPAGQLLGLDPSTGRQRWAIEHSEVNYRALTDTTAVLSAGDDGTASSLTGIDTATGTTRWSSPVEANGHPCQTRTWSSMGDSVAATCEVGTSDEPVTWVLRYSVATGKLLDEASLGTEVVQSATVTTDGRVVVVAESRRTPTCPVTVIQADGTRSDLPGLISGSSCIDTVEALGDQVLLVNIVSGEIRALQ